MSGFDIANWAVSICYAGGLACFYVLKNFLSFLYPLIGVILGMFLAYTAVRVIVSRILGGALASASDSVVHPKTPKYDYNDVPGQLKW